MIPSPDFDEEYILADGRDRMPLSYTVQAVKRIECESYSWKR
jgi:hypothetical protein